MLVAAGLGAMCAVSGAQAQSSNMMMHMMNSGFYGSSPTPPAPKPHPVPHPVPPPHPPPVPAPHPPPPVPPPHPPPPVPAPHPPPPHPPPPHYNGRKLQGFNNKVNKMAAATNRQSERRNLMSYFY